MCVCVCLSLRKYSLAPPTVPQEREAVQPNGEMLEPGSLNGLKI